MKQKILLLSNIYPDPSSKLLNTTSVCHYFVFEWIKMGYDVKVIYNYTIYTRLLHIISHFFEFFIANWAVSSVNTQRQIEIKKYTIDGVKVEKMPIYKFFPRTKFPFKSILKQVKNIINSNKEDNFVPNIIIGHFHNPSLELVNLLKEHYSVKTCIVLHGDTLNIKKMYKNNYTKLIKNIDIWGYRSIAIGKSFEATYGVQKQSFICRSGVPKSYLTQHYNKIFNDQIKTFIYVGTLIKRKHPISLIYALNKVYQNNNYCLTYVGDGAEKKKMIRAAKNLDLFSNINFLGQISRDQVSKEIASSECFIMISEGETFGLVYLEAMAKGCITIGSRNEGIDGVIIDGENGFLCEPGNYEELAEVIEKINLLSNEEKNRIAFNAIKTASNLTDYNVAKDYIETVINFN